MRRGPMRGILKDFDSSFVWLNHSHPMAVLLQFGFGKQSL
jgi:hypothetical protein